MPRKAAGEHALRTVRLSRIAAASTFAGATLALAAGCSAGSGIPTACCAYTGSPIVASTGISPSPVPSPSPNGELTEPPATATTDDDETTPDDLGSFDLTFSYSPSFPTIDPSLLLPSIALPNDSPYGDGTCFQGPKLTSTTPIDVNNMDEVDCSASDADYKVIKTITGTTDLNDCNNVSDAQYAFSEQDTGVYGVTLWSAVYCLVGLGSYAD